MNAELLSFQDALAGEYSIEREIGRGGMGVVLLAHEVQLDRPVAIKVLLPSLAARAGVRERFFREARTAASLSHPNIVPIHRVSEAAGLPYFAMTYVEGSTLGERLRERGPIPASLMTQIMRDVGQALGYAHSRGVVHRDVKPDNILLDHTTGRALVTDFGIATTVEAAPTDTPAGTIGFVSPEQLAGAGADGRSDLYALGVVAHLALTGALPAGAGQPRDVPPRLATAIAQCLAANPNERFGSAEAMLASLDAEVAVSRPALPPALRAWASDQVPLLPLYGFMSFSGAMTSVTAVGLGIPLAMWSLGFAFLPILPISIYQLRKTRRALAEGYRLADLRFALRAWRTERVTQIERTAEEHRRWWMPVVTRLPVYAVTVGIVSAGLFGLAGGAGGFLASRLATLVAVGSLATLTALGLPIVPPTIERRVVGRLRGWLWNSRVGEWLARRLTPRVDGVPLSAFRPTEMALSLAIDDLHAALPAAYRESLGELPATAQRLLARVTRLRDARAQLASHSSDVTAADELQRATAANEAQLAETVAALERLRVGLLRLHGGLVDVRAVSTELKAAETLARDVGRLVDAQEEVSEPRSPLAFERHSPSPA